MSFLFLLQPAFAQVERAVEQDMESVETIDVEAEMETPNERKRNVLIPLVYHVFQLIILTFNLS